jgi:hypothetical protein
MRHSGYSFPLCGLPMLNTDGVGKQYRKGVQTLRYSAAGRLHMIRAKVLNSTLAIVSRQEGGMSRTIDELCERSCARRRTSHATPPRSDQTGLGAFCATLVAANLAPCPDPPPGHEAHPRSPHGARRLAGDGIGGGAPFHQRPSRLEPGDPGQRARAVRCSAAS